MTADLRRDRFQPGTVPDGAGRAPFADDRDRVLASGAFWRLRHVTQVMTPSAPGHFHNRLSHSLAVARIGRRMVVSLLGRPGGATTAEAAGGLDPDVVEAACLAHDLGHPPFGHDAEDELDQVLTVSGVADGFEANAQTFRIVTTLGQHGARARGLNLTRATTAAILKYPWTRAESPVPGKWGVYESEAAELAWARELLPPGSLEPTLEAAVMDLADLIAYAVHDFEDFVCAGAIPMERLRADRVERERLLDLVGTRRRIGDGERDELAHLLDGILADCPRGGRAAIGRYTARRIDEVIGAVGLTNGRAGSSALVIDREREMEILLLEGLTWHYVIDSELLHPQRNEQRQIIRSLFGRLADAAMIEAGLDAFPASFRTAIRDAECDATRLRVVADVIASMTEEAVMEGTRDRRSDGPVLDRQIGNPAEGAVARYENYTN